MAEISIVIPVYNAARFLREALASLQAQTFTEWECICVNDGSTDESPTIIREMMASDPRIQLLEQANAGLSAARNRGVERSQAPYIFFMDADDLLYPKALETLYRTIQETDAEVVWGRTQRFVDDLPTPSETGEVRTIEGAALRQWVGEDERSSQSSSADAFGGISIEAWGKLFKRDVILRNPQPEELRIGEDNLFSMRLFRMVTRVSVVDAAIYGYRQVTGSLCKQRTATWLLGYTEAFCKVLAECGDNPILLSNYLESSALTKWFIGSVFTDVLLARQVALYPAIQIMCKTFLSHPAFRLAKPKLKFWLWLGAHQWWWLLRWNYKHSNLYKKSLKW